MKYRIQTNGKKFRVQHKFLWGWITVNYYGDDTRWLETEFDTKQQAEHYIALEKIERANYKRSETWTVVE